MWILWLTRSHESMENMDGMRRTRAEGRDVGKRS